MSGERVDVDGLRKNAEDSTVDAGAAKVDASVPLKGKNSGGLLILRCEGKVFSDLFHFVITFMCDRLLRFYNLFPAQVPALGPVDASFDTLLGGSKMSSDSRNTSYYLHEFDFFGRSC